MTLLSLFALVLPAALVAPKATKRETQLAEQWEREIQLNTRLQTAGADGAPRSAQNGMRGLVGWRRGLEADRAPVAD
jgi:hypothetical protein